MTIHKLRAEMDELKNRAQELRRSDIYMDRADWSKRLVREHEQYCKRSADYTFETYLANCDDRPHYPLKPEFRAMAASSDIADAAELYQFMLQRTRFL